ncbi:MAG: AAA family ATPase [Subdoligranulum variabile]|nr:AAA family ATPase [Subdoligranulum variabile]
MKLIRCHIENFGVLSDFDFSFAEGLTTICQSNGFGKSTFAAFIKAMFYGFPRTGARNIVENERKRYDPWQGGKYGGYLEFEVQDVSYRVTRYFGKTAAKDTFSLLDLTNRRPSTRFSEKLGEELFQLDADSFARSTYADLHEKKLAAEDELREIDAKIHAKNEEIQAMFERYYPHDTYRDDFVKRLRDSLSKYQRLTEEARTVSAKRDDLKARIEDDRSKIIPVLHRYYPIELPKDLRQGIRTLSGEVTAYNDLKAKKKAMLDGNAKYQERADALKASICKILLTYKALDQALPYDTCLQNLRKRFDRYKEASERVTHYTQELENSTSRKNQANAEVQKFLQKYQLSDDTPENIIDYADDDIRSREATKKALGEAQRNLNIFLKENPGVEADVIDIDNDLADPEVLQESEKQLQNMIDGIEAELRDLRQERDRIRRSVENIPAWEDRMARLQNEQEEDERKCALADQTLALLSQAKDNLANSYVGRVERGFESYANTLMGDQLGDVMVDRDLHLYIDEKGAAREVGSFSAGTVDCIMLCMRLSLVDALFGDEKPFLILDDPFVNLDDEHMSRCVIWN